MHNKATIIQAHQSLKEAKNLKLSSHELIHQAILLAALLLEESHHHQTRYEARRQRQLAKMMHDPFGKIFTMAITDQCFRSMRSSRIANQINYIMGKYGIPAYFSFPEKIALNFFRLVGEWFNPVLVPLFKEHVRKETDTVILPASMPLLKKHLEKRRQEQVRLNLNHLGEAILGEEEALRRLQIYLNDLSHPAIDCISVKISTIYSQINLLAWDETIDKIASRLRQLYRAAMSFPYLESGSFSKAKFVTLDMEEYRDLHLTLALFKKVLDEPEFLNLSAGIVLQSYLPDSYLLQQNLTEWALERMKNGGAPIKIRLVKGANLAMEQFEAATRLWEQAPYTTKIEVDANFKRMLMYGCQKDHATAVHLGIASHNLFDIAYALLLRAQNNLEKEIGFEMLEGMADAMRRAVQELSNSMLLYCPVANPNEFQNAVAYLVRRLDENTAPENFLTHAFDLQPYTAEWQKQADDFTRSFSLIPLLSTSPNRKQNRLQDLFEEKLSFIFMNEADTDWSLLANQKWAFQIKDEWIEKELSFIPLVINGHELPIQSSQSLGKGNNPNSPGQILYQYALATWEQVDDALNCAKQVQHRWSKTEAKTRAILLLNIAKALKQQRAALIGIMMKETGKTIIEADIEISEAIDFANYYAINLLEWESFSDLHWQAKGPILVASPWNFPCSIPTGGILAALAAGNCVIFKPAPEAIGCGWALVKIFWEAGVSAEVLQFINCEDEPIGSQLVQDPRLAAIILTGATATAELFIKLRPDLDLMAETGGKNTLVITALADRDLAIKDLIQSAFGHAGQKCSACSLAILEAEVYDDPHFLQQLKDAASSLFVGTAWDFRTRINPLIHPPTCTLLRGLTELDEGETWLLQPKQDPNNTHLWSPGIKMGVKPESFTFQQELFGPVLGLVRAADFEEALIKMNQTPYGLTAGIHSLDEREQKRWLQNIVAGNCYINRTITGAIVERQPFGGCKQSSFGRGLKAGGPNYLTQLMHVKNYTLPLHLSEPASTVKEIMQAVHHSHLLSSDQEKKWQAACKSYAFYWQNYFFNAHDPCLVRGEDNLQCYYNVSKVFLIVQATDSLMDILLQIIAAVTCQTPMMIISHFERMTQKLHLLKLPALIELSPMPLTALHYEIKKTATPRIRLLSQPETELRQTLIQMCNCLNAAPVQLNGRLELLHFLREVSVSYQYHRYGNLGEREKEKRTPLINAPLKERKTCYPCDLHE